MSDNVSVLQSLNQLTQDINAQSFVQLPELSEVEIQELNDPEFGAPSGPRQRRHGTLDTRQGIVSAQMTADGIVILRITLLCSGFVMGEGGQSVADINQQSGAIVESRVAFLDALQVDNADNSNAPNIRIVTIKGAPLFTLRALQIVRAAVHRYQDLVYGKVQEKITNEEQYIAGVRFMYKPPPLKDMPNAVRTYKKAASLPGLDQNQNDVDDYDATPSGTGSPHSPAVLPVAAPSWGYMPNSQTTGNAYSFFTSVSQTSGQAIQSQEQAVGYVLQPDFSGVTYNNAYAYQRPLFQPFPYPCPYSQGQPRPYGHPQGQPRPYPYPQGQPRPYGHPWGYPYAHPQPYSHPQFSNPQPALWNSAPPALVTSQTETYYCENSNGTFFHNYQDNQY